MGVPWKSAGHNRQPAEHIAAHSDCNQEPSGLTHFVFLSETIQGLTFIVTKIAYISDLPVSVRSLELCRARSWPIFSALEISPANMFRPPSPKLMSSSKRHASSLR